MHACEGTYAYLWICVYMYVCVHVCMHACLHTYTSDVCIHARMGAYCMHVDVCKHVYVCMHGGILDLLKNSKNKMAYIRMWVNAYMIHAWLT
jgi:hypothetical protein